MSEPGRTIVCPNCATRYFLPDVLMGGGGARVRCPNCSATFSVSREGHEAAASRAVSRVADAAGAPAESGAAGLIADRPGSAGEPGHLARRLLDELAEGRGAEIREAATEGRLFAAYGPEIMEAYDAYRREVGREADPAPFRNALRERWGIDLLPGELE